jgi:hypothetical protein
LAATANESTPALLMVGAAEKSEELLLLMMLNVTVCDDSLAGPSLMSVAHAAE